MILALKNFLNRIEVAIARLLRVVFFEESHIVGASNERQETRGKNARNFKIFVEDASSNSYSPSSVTMLFIFDLSKSKSFTISSIICFTFSAV